MHKYGNHQSFQTGYSHSAAEEMQTEAPVLDAMDSKLSAKVEQPDQIFDKMESKISESVKNEQPEVYVDYPNQG